MIAVSDIDLPKPFNGKLCKREKKRKKRTFRQHCPKLTRLYKRRTY